MKHKPTSMWGVSRLYKNVLSCMNSYELATSLPKRKIVTNSDYSVLVLLKIVVECVESFTFIVFFVGVANGKVLL